MDSGNHSGTNSVTNSALPGDNPRGHGAMVPSGPPPPDYTTDLGHGEARMSNTNDSEGEGSVASRPATPPIRHPSSSGTIRPPSPLLSSIDGVEGRSEL